MKNTFFGLLATLSTALLLTALPTVASEITYTYLDLHGDEVTKRYAVDDQNRAQFVIDYTGGYAFILDESYAAHADPALSEYDRTRLLNRYSPLDVTFDKQSAIQLEEILTQKIKAQGTRQIRN